MSQRQYKRGSMATSSGEDVVRNEVIEMRNAFNRLMVLVVSFVSLGFGIIVLLLLAGWITPGEVSTHGTILFSVWNFFAQMRHANPLFDILVGAICALVGLVVFIMELSPARSQPMRQPM